MGDCVATLLDGKMKMGAHDSVGDLLHGMPEDPSQGGWGGRFVRAWKRPRVVFTRLTGPQDRIEQFGVFELALPMGDLGPARLEARMLIENRELVGSVDADRVMRWRFSPKDAKTYRYMISSNVLALEVRSSELTSPRPPPMPPSTLRHDCPSGGRTIHHRMWPKASTSGSEL